VGGANIDVTLLFCLRDESEHYAKGLRQTALKAGKRHTMYIITDKHRHAHIYNIMFAYIACIIRPPIECPKRVK